MKGTDDKTYNPHSHDAVLSRIETTLKQIDGKVDELKSTQERHRERMDQFDRWRWWIIGASGALATAGSSAVLFIPKLIN
jgi:hypothetical protein